MQTSFQVVLDDTSPVINYFPFAETLGVANLLAGWNSYFSASGFLSKFGELGQGASLHVTGLDGAALTVQWKGTGISLFGSTFRSTYDVSIDGQPAVLGTTQNGLLANFQELGDGEHILELVAHPAISIDDSSYVAFDRALLNVTTPFTGADVFKEYIDINNSTLWHLIGNWEQVSGTVPDPTPFQGFRQSTTPGNLAEIFFQGSAVSVVGLRNTTTGQYNVTLDGNTTTFLGHSDWLEPSTLFLQTGLDEHVKHALTITNIDGPALAIAGLEITHVQGGTPVATFHSSGSNGNSSPTLPVGTVLALVLAGLVGLLIVGTLLLCIRFRRKKLRARKTTYLANPITSDMYDVIEPLSSREDDWNRDIENNQPYPSTSPQRRESNVTSLPYSRLQPATNMRERVDAVSGTGIAAWGKQKPDVEVGRARRVKSVRIDLPTLEGIRTGGNSGDLRDSSASIYELPSPRLRTEPPFPKLHSQPQSPPQSLHKYSSRASKRPRSSRPRSISLGQHPLPSRIDTPKSEDGTVGPSNSRRTSGSLLMSPVRRYGRPRQSRHGSFGTHQSVSMVEEPSPVTISTINFARPNRESAFSQMSLNDRRRPSLPVETFSSDLLPRLKAYREMQESPSSEPQR